MTTEQTAAVPAPGTDLRDIALALIDVPAGRRALDPDWVETLAAEFQDNPQRTPIDVLQVGGRFELVTGGHRYAARLKAGHHDIRAIVWQRTDFRHHSQIKLVEIAENFMRRELSVLDKAFDVAAWREVYETVQGAVKRGGDRRSKSKSQVETLIGDDAVDAAAETFAAAFTVAAQRALGLSRANVFRSLKIAALGEASRQRISLLPIANNQSELLSLVAQPPARQALVIDKLIDGAVSVADAVAIIDDIAPPTALTPWEKMSERFSRLAPAQQHQFFDLHKEAILLWVAEQKR